MAVNLELRRAALEACGWKFVQVKSDAPGGFSWRVGEHAPDFGITDRSMELILPRLPAIEHDPAVSEPMFLAWCEKNGYEWELMTCRPHDTWTELHYVLWVHRAEPEFEVEAADCSTARAKAMAGGKK